MDFSYFRISDTIVYGDSFGDTSDDLNSLSFVDLDNTYQAPFEPKSEAGIFNDLEAFKHMEITNWRGEECLDWAMEVCQRQGIDRNTVNLSAFRRVTGDELMAFSMYDFCRFDTVYGPLFYEEFQQLLQSRGLAPAGHPQPETNNIFAEREGSFKPYEESDLCDLSALEPDEDLSEFLSYMDHPGSSWDSLMHDNDNINMDESSFIIDDCVTIKSEETCSEFSDDGSMDASCSSPDPLCVPTCDVLGKIRTKSRKRERGPKNWEYMLRLLMDQRYNPSLIRWEDKEEKTFRLVKPVIIAQMWGQRSNKPTLSYDNFARGLRYQYKTGALKPVPERQLVYKCGPKALKFLKDLQREGY